MTIAATPEREFANDVMVGKRLRSFAAGLHASAPVLLRRTAQLRRYRPDLKVESIRGNIDTRLRKLDEGQYDAIVLAAAGLRRLGWNDRVAEVLAPEVMCPAVGQGTLAIETRTEGAGFDACAVLDHPWTRFCITAERAVLATFGGRLPDSHGQLRDALSDNEMQITGVVIDARRQQPDSRTDGGRLHAAHQARARNRGASDCARSARDDRPRAERPAR